jgi:hypothetical protein
MSRLLLSLSLLFLSLGLSACIKDTNAEGKAELQKIFETIISDQQSMFSGDSEVSLKIIDELQIEENGDHFNVTLPKMIYTGVKNSQFHLNPIHIKATPTSEAGNWDMVVTFPKIIQMLDAQGNQISAITIGDQNTEGRWNENLKSFSKITASYKDIAILKKTGDIGVSMKTMKLVSDLTETSKGLWSGPSKVEITNFSADDNVVLIKKITSTSQIKDYSIQANEELRNSIKENPDNPGIIFSSIFKNLASNLSFTMQMDGLTIDKKSHQKNGKTIPAKKFAMGKAYMNFSTQNAAAETVDQRISFGYKNLKSPRLDALIPTSTNFGLFFQSIPIQQLSDMSKDIGIKGDNSQTQKTQVMQKIMGLPQILAAANSSIILEKTGFQNDIYNVSISADIKANSTSMFGAVGSLSIAIDGLEKTLEEINKKKSTVTPEQGNKLNQAIQTLSMIQVIGDKQGSSYVLNFTATEDAKLLLNGKDMSALMAAGVF